MSNAFNLKLPLIKIKMINDNNNYIWTNALGRWTGTWKKADDTVQFDLNFSNRDGVPFVQFSTLVNNFYYNHLNCDSQYFNWPKLGMYFTNISHYYVESASANELILSTQGPYPTSIKLSRVN